MTTLVSYYQSLFWGGCWGACSATTFMPQQLLSIHRHPRAGPLLEFTQTLLPSAACWKVHTICFSPGTPKGMGFHLCGVDNDERHVTQQESRAPETCSVQGQEQHSQRVRTATKLLQRHSSKGFMQADYIPFDHPSATRYRRCCWITLV